MGKHAKKTNECHRSELRVLEHGVLVVGTYMSLR